MEYKHSFKTTQVWARIPFSSNSSKSSLWRQRRPSWPQFGKCSREHWVFDLPLPQPAHAFDRVWETVRSSGDGSLRDVSLHYSESGGIRERSHWSLQLHSTASKALVWSCVGFLTEEGVQKAWVESSGSGQKSGIKCTNRSCSRRDRRAAEVNPEMASHRPHHLDHLVSWAQFDLPFVLGPLETNKVATLSIRLRRHQFPDRWYQCPCYLVSILLWLHSHDNLRVVCDNILCSGFHCLTAAFVWFPCVTTCERIHVHIRGTSRSSVNNPRCVLQVRHSHLETGNCISLSLRPTSL